MRYRVEHVTRYVYASPVDLATHLVHMQPRPLPHQQIVEASLDISPDPARVYEQTDFFGNPATWIFFDRPHKEFTVTLQATVDVEFPRPPEPDETPPWEDVAQAALMGGPGAWDSAGFAYESTVAGPDAEATAYAAKSFPAGRPVLAGLLELTARIKKEFTFKSGVTNVSTSVARVMSQRMGVCQDFSNVMIAGLRGLGLPARYVSGYLRTHPPPGMTAHRGADQSHAWVGCWMGPDHGWIDLDPTNNLVVHEEHVVLGWGRGYGDVSPVRGVLLGGGRHSVRATVDLAPAEEETA